MAKTSVTRRKVPTSSSATATAAATAEPDAAATPPDLEDQLFRIACRAAIYAAAAEHLNDDDAPAVEKAAVAALPVGLSEIHADLMKIVDQLGNSARREARS
jgi:hypothetical protein